MATEEPSGSGFPLLLLIGGVVALGLVVILGGFFLLRPSTQVHSSSSGFSFRTESNCDSTNTTCTISIMISAQATGDMQVTNLTSLPAGATFTPSEFIIAPGSAVQFLAKAPAGVCMSSIQMTLIDAQHHQQQVSQPLGPCPQPTASP